MSTLGELWLPCHHAYTPNRVNTERQYLHQMIYHPFSLCACVSFDKYLAVHKLVVTKPEAAPCLSFLVEMHPLTPMHRPCFAKPPLLPKKAGVVLQGRRGLSRLVRPTASPGASRSEGERAASRPSQSHPPPFIACSDVTKLTYFPRPPTEG